MLDFSREGLGRGVNNGIAMADTVESVAGLIGPQEYDVLGRIEDRQAHNRGTVPGEHREGDWIREVNQALLRTATGTDALARSSSRLAERAVEAYNLGCVSADEATRSLGRFQGGLMGAARELALEAQTDADSHARTLDNVGRVMGFVNTLGSTLPGLSDLEAEAWGAATESWRSRTDAGINAALAELSSQARVVPEEAFSIGGVPRSSNDPYWYAFLNSVGAHRADVWEPQSQGRPAHLD